MADRETPALLTVAESARAVVAAEGFVKAWAEYSRVKTAMAERAATPGSLDAWRMAFVRAVERTCAAQGLSYDTLRAQVLTLVKLLRATAAGSSSTPPTRH